MTTQLTPHFSLEEMVATSHLIDNTPTPAIIARLTQTAQALETVRALLGNLPMSIDSGYRCPALNAAVGGVPDSAHLIGFAADFVCPEFGDPLSICHAIEASDIQFDQVIEEGTWVHFAIGGAMRRQVLTKNPGGGYSEGLAG